MNQDYKVNKKTELGLLTLYSRNSFYGNNNCTVQVEGDLFRKSLKKNTPKTGVDRWNRWFQMNMEDVSCSFNS